jgi:DNA-binding response OmpR family regulator
MKCRILIVEDEPSLLSAIAEYMEKHGYQVHCASEREEAEALLANHNYALVITDLALTKVGYDGFDVVAHAWDRPARPKIIVLSGMTLPEFEEEAALRGADVFLRKPQSLQEIAETAARLLRDEVLI